LFYKQSHLTVKASLQYRVQRGCSFSHGRSVGYFAVPMHTVVAIDRALGANAP